MLISGSFATAAGRSFPFQIRQDSGSFNSILFIQNGYISEAGSSSAYSSGSLWLGTLDGSVGAARGLSTSGLTSTPALRTLIYTRYADGTASLWENGVQIAAQLTGTLNDVTVGTAMKMSLGGNCNSDGFASPDPLHLVYVSNRALGNIELAKLSRNPWQMFETQSPKRIAVLLGGDAVASGGTGTSVGSGSGGDQPGVATGGTGVSTGSGSGGTATGVSTGVNYIDDFQSYAVSAGVPTGWSSRWDGGTWSIVDISGDKYLRQSDTAANRRLVSWDTVDSDTSRDNVEILAVLKTNHVDALNAHLGVVARASGTGSTETGYAAVVYGDELIINRYMSGTGAVIAQTSVLSLAINTRYKIRFRLNGSALKVKIWADAGSEPGTWDLEVTDANISAAGWVGCFGFGYLGTPQDEHDFAAIAVATNGGTALLTSPDGTASGGTGVSAGSGTGGTATGVEAGVASGGTGVSTGSGTGGTAVGTVITLDASYERSSVILSTSSVVGSGDSAVVSIRPKVQESEAGNHAAGEWLEPSVDVLGVNGYRPTFRFLNYFDGDNGMLGADASWASTRRPMYSYDDGLTWTYFDTAVTRDTTNNWIEFRNSTAFTADKIRVGRSRQMTVHQVGDWLETLDSTYSFFGPTATATAYTPTGAVSGFAAQALIANEFSTQTDSLGNTVPATPLYAAEINDTSLTPAGGGAKRLAVLLGGVHAGEDHANHVLKAFIAHLCGASAEAQALRREYRFLLYPMINAPGRAGGGWRGSWTQGSWTQGSVGADDANRHFSDLGSTLEIVDKPKAAITTDRAGEVPDWMMDFHGDWGGTWGVIAAAGNAPQARFMTLLESFDTISVPDVGTPLSGFTTTYFDTLGSKLTVTFEVGDTAPVTDTQITENGVALVQTMDAMVAEGAFFAIATGGTGTSTGSGSGGTATGEAITLAFEASYERSSVNLSGSSISGTGDAAVVSILPKTQESEVATFGIAWLVPSVDVVGVNGIRPTFRFLAYKNSSGGNHGYSDGWPSTMRPMYSYDDGLTWLYFDTNVTRDAGNEWIEFRNSTAFTSNKVRISRSRQVTVHQVGDWLATLDAAHTFFGPTAAATTYTPTGAVSAYAAQALIADEFSEQTDSLGATIAVTPFYAAEINDTSLTPAGGGSKRLAVLTGGVHAGEDPAFYTLKAFVAYLCGSSTEAQALRREYRILLYPMMNAPGRAGGGWRGSWTQGLAGADDINRHFSDTNSTLEVVDKPKAVMTTDRASAVPDWVIDFHGAYSGLWSYSELAANSYHVRWKAMMLARGYTLSDVGSPPSGSTETYWRNMGAKLAVTSEQGETSPVTDAAIVAYGENELKVVYDLMVEGAFFAIATGGTGTSTGSATGGTAVGNVAASGGTGTSTGSGTGGTATGLNAGLAPGAALSSTSSVVGGPASGSHVASGAAVSTASSISGGVAFGEGTGSGAALAVTASIVGGAASGTIFGTAPGASVTVSASITAGAASSINPDATAPGAAIVVVASIAAGSAIAPIMNPSLERRFTVQAENRGMTL